MTMKLETLRVDIECDVCLKVVRVKPEVRWAIDNGAYRDYGELTGSPETPIPGWDHELGDICPECAAAADPPLWGITPPEA